jgi:hypothetical protein
MKKSIKTIQINININCYDLLIRINSGCSGIGMFPTKRQRKKGNEIERRCACRRNRWQWQDPCREAFERFESWQTERMYAVTADAMEANGGLQRSNNKFPAARVPGGSCCEGF